MSMSVSVSTEIAAAPEVVWGLVTDLSRMDEWSPEAAGIEWRKGSTAPVVGAAFRGMNKHGKRAWSTDCRISEATEPRRFAFHATAVGLKIAEWRYDLDASDVGCRLTETWIDERGVLAKMLGKLVTGVDEREAHNRSTMTETLAKLKAVAESASATH